WKGEIPSFSKGCTPSLLCLEGLQDFRLQSDAHLCPSHSQVSRKTISLSFSVEQDLPVSNVKPASVLLYDYYETGRRALFRPHTKWGAVSQHLLKLMEGHYNWEADEGLGTQ
uniref:Alpha-macroglobulin receptor-binding domain-containing protein n=1 Tax=Chrysemys picta bellii TaxID=8478 RepID=A0A8C3H547_CHRPI